jgi:hypothetical protein
MSNKNLKVGNWSIEKVEQKLADNHLQENQYNKELASIDKTFKALLIRKKKLAKLISKNMKYRNLLIKIFMKTK